MTFTTMSLTEYFVVFIRTAGCIMLLPGFSMTQIPMQVRLFFAVGMSCAIFMLVESTLSIRAEPTVADVTGLIFSELIIAAALALSVRFLFLALSFLGEIIMTFMGLNPIPGTPIGEDQATTTLSSLFNITAVVMFFSTGLVLQFMAALVSSFSALPPGFLVNGGGLVESLSENLSHFFNIVIRLGSPIIIYAIILNAISGLVNKLTPQIPVYFVSAPFLICGGLVALIWIADDIILLFTMEVEAFIDRLF